MGRENIFNDHHRSVFETASGCMVCDGPQSWYKPLGDWICSKRECGANNRPHNARCFKKCGGLPEPDHIDKQAEAQRAHRGLKPGAAPYVPPGKRAAAAGAKPKAKAKAESPEAKRIREQDARIKKQDDELKKLRAGGGGGGAGNAVDKGGDAADTKAKDLLKALEAKLQRAKKMAADYPDDLDFSKMVTKIENEIQEARPAKTAQTKLQLLQEVEVLEGSIKAAREQIEKKRKWIGEKTAEVRGQICKLCDANLGREFELAELNMLLAERERAAAPAPVQTAPTPTPHMAIEQLPALFEATKKELFQVHADQTWLQVPGKEVLKQVGDKWGVFEEFVALLCTAKATLSQERDYAMGVVSTNMPPEGAALGGASPERAAGLAAHPLLEPPIPPPVGDGATDAGGDYVDLDGFLPFDTEETPLDASKALDWEDTIESYEKFMALARAGKAKGKGKGKEASGSEQGKAGQTTA